MRKTSLHNQVTDYIKSYFWNSFYLLCSPWMWQSTRQVRSSQRQNILFLPSVLFQSFHIVLFFQQVSLHFLRQRQVIDVVSPHFPKNEKATHVLQGWHATKARHRIQELNGKRGRTGARRTKEVKEAAILGILHCLFDELADLSFAVGVWLRPEAEQAWKAQTKHLNDKVLNNREG